MFNRRYLTKEEFKNFQEIIIDTQEKELDILAYLLQQAMESEDEKLKLKEEKEKAKTKKEKTPTVLKAFEAFKEEVGGEVVFKPGRRIHRDKDGDLMYTTVHLNVKVPKGGRLTYARLKVLASALNEIGKTGDNKKAKKGGSKKSDEGKKGNSKAD